MSVSFTRSMTSAAVLLTVVLAGGVVLAQIPTGSSARAIPTDVDRTNAQVSQLISRAEDHFRKGKLNLDDSKRDAARDEFDKAVDTILESGLDVRANQRLQTFYLELVERIYREEVPIGHGLPQTTNGGALIAQSGKPGTSAQTAPPAPVRVGFREQKFEPSPLDTLSKLELTEDEKRVSQESLDTLAEAKGNLDFKVTVNPLIQQYINYYQGRGRTTMEIGLRRSGRFMKMARQIFQQEGVPLDITWLGQVESAWHERAVSNKAASGLWQFIPAAGSTYGLRQTAWIDERNSLEQATRASARYLKDLSRRYNGDWQLAMAGYNTGAGNVDRAIARAGKADFWSIYPYIYPETRNYVPNILAVILIAKNPEKYGFQGIKPEAPLSYDVVQVPTATSLQLIADATDSSTDYLRNLNPELRRDVTPRGDTYNVRVPAGRSKQLVALLKRIPGDKRDSARVVQVAPGEDFQAVANRIGVSVAQLQAFNNGVDLKSTSKLVVPNGNLRLTNWRRTTPEATQAPVPTLTKIRARKGDTIATIAAAHNVSADDLARLNNLPMNGQLQAGQEIRLLATASSVPSPKRRHHR